MQRALESWRSPIIILRLRPVYPLTARRVIPVTNKQVSTQKTAKDLRMVGGKTAEQGKGLIASYVGKHNGQ